MSTAIAQTFVVTALCCYNAFGVGFFFLSNAFYYASFCSHTPAVSAPGSMLFSVLMGIIIGVVSIAGTFELCREAITHRIAARMMCTGTYYCVYTVLAFHLILSCLDARFVVMGAVVICGFILSMRYDVADALVAWALSAVAGFTILVIEHTYAEPHAMNTGVECTSTTTATAGLIAGGIWAAIPPTFSTCYVIQFMADGAEASDAKSKQHAPRAPSSLVVTACVFSAVLHIIPIVAQSANALDAWAPMLHAGTYARIIENIDSRPLTLFAIIAQSLLLLASVGPVMWLLMAEVISQGRMRSSDSAMWLITVVLIAAWSSILVYADFATLVWLYIASAAVVVAMAPVAAIMDYIIEK